MAKNRDKGNEQLTNPTENKSFLAQQKLAHQELEEKVKELPAGEKKEEIENLLKLNELELQNAKVGNEGKFKKSINTIQKRMDSINAKLKAVSVGEDPGTTKLHEDIKKLEAVAATEDVEFKKYEGRYVAAEGEFLNLLDAMKEGGLVIDENKKTEFEDKLSIMLDSLTGQKYDDFKKQLQEFTVKFNIFKFPIKKQLEEIQKEVGDVETKIEPVKEEDISPEELEKFKINLGVNENQPEPEKKKAVKASKSVVVKTPIVTKITENIQRATPEQEEKEWEDRRRLHQKLTQEFESLDKTIGKTGRYDKELNAMEGYLDTAEETNDLKVFDRSINNFNDLFKLLKKEVEPVVEKPVEEKKEEVKIELELEPLELEKPKEPKKPSTKLKTSEKEPVVAGEIEGKGVVAEKAVEPESKVEVSQDYPREAEVKPEEPKKKGLWGRLKERGKKITDAIFNRETGKVAGKVGYDTVTSVMGVKLITDGLLALKGKGDIAEWWKGGKESKGSRKAINEAYQSLMESFEKNKKSKTLEESEKIEKHLADLRTKVGSANISPEEKKTLLDRLWLIAMKHQEDSKAAVKERDSEVKRALEAYLQGKISTMKIARDGLNTLLTATGLSMLRGIMYASASILERRGKAKKDYIKQSADVQKKEESAFIRSEFARSAVETAHSLVGELGKKDVGGVKRAVNFAKAWGTVMRGFGIYGVAMSGTDSTEQSIDKLISGIKERGVTGALSTVYDNFVQNSVRVFENVERAGHYTKSAAEGLVHAAAGDLAYHPTEIFEHTAPQQPEIPSAPEYPPVVKHEEIPVPAEAPAGIGIDQIIAEHKLSPEFSDSLVNLLKAHPELSNKESIENILNASKIGPDAHSHHENILTGTIDTLDESGGERRQVIFEEILKHGGPKAAADYLQSQHFSSYHLRHLSGYIRKGTPDEYLKFAEKYNIKDARMVSGLFQAMQGRESTDLANAGLEVDAVNGKPGIDNHVHGKVSYFGLEGGKPVLSGSGTVTVDQMGVRGATVEKNITPGKDLDLGKTTIQESIREDWQKMGSRLAPQWEGNTDVSGQQVEATSPASTYVEKTITTFKSSESIPVVESAPVEKSIPAERVPASKQVPETSVQKSTIITPEKSTVIPEPHADAPLNKFLKEHGSSQKEFVGTYEKMVDATAVSFVGMEDTLFPKAGANEFFQAKTHYLDSLQEKYKNALEHGSKLSATDLRKIEKLLQAEELFKKGDERWGEILNQAVFSKEDAQVIELAFLPHPNPDTNPILANGSHAFRIRGEGQNKDFFLYVENSTFSLDDNGNLVEKYATGKRVRSYQEVLKMIQK